jgi:lipoprotein-anchoring transpeptidase ErfK/SrfK
MNGGAGMMAHSTETEARLAFCGSRATAGCIRMVNEDVVDLYDRVKVGTKVVVLPAAGRQAATGFSMFR